MTMEDEPRLTSLAHGGGCGCKIAPNVLQDLLSESPVLSHTQLIVDAATSDDAAVYKVSDDVALIATTDFFMPIVDDPRDFGAIAATNALSDIYAMGGRPIFSLALVGMPIDKMKPETIRKILAGGREVAEAAGAPIAGGHSIDSAEPIYGLVALGLARPDHVLRNAGAKDGDVLILGKSLGVGVFSSALKKGLLPITDYAQMIEATTRLNTPGADLPKIEGVHAATDVTGFGLAGHLAEMCRGSGLSATLHWDKVPVFESARALAAAGNTTGAGGRNWTSIQAQVADADSWSKEQRDILCDPQTSGGLLVACDPSCAEAVLHLFMAHGHDDATIVGEMVAGPAQLHLG